MPTNTDPTTAIEIAIPITIVVDAPVDTTEHLWWKHQAISTDYFPGFLARSSGANFKPRVNMWTGDDPTALTAMFITPDGLQPANVPMLSGQWYYWDVSDIAAAAPNTGLTLTLDIYDPPTDPITAGTLTIPDENPAAAGGGTFPAAVLGSTTGAYLLAWRIGAGEFAAILPTGIFLMSEVNALGAVLYDAAGDVITAVPGAMSTDLQRVTSDRLHIFYMTFDHLASGVITAVSDAGVLLGTTWTVAIFPIDSIGVFGTTLLYTDSAGFSAIHAHDLTTDLPLADFAPSIAGATTSLEMYQLADGTLLVMYIEAGGLRVINFSQAGAILHDWSGLDRGTGSDPRLAMGIADPDTFWTRTFNTPAAAINTYRLYRLSTGALLRTITPVYEFNGGIGPPEGTAGDPPPQFGPANSCPFWETPLSVAPGCPGEVSGPRIDGLPYVPPTADPCAGSGQRGSPRIGA